MSIPAEWETFYVIIGSSAAALTGLQFVVVALSADAERIGGGPETEVFGTPTIVHFCAVLLIAAFLSVPRQTAGSLALCLAAEGLGGLIYAVIVKIRLGREMRYVPVLEDRIFHIVLPFAAYATLFVSGIATNWHEVGALYFVAAAALVLMLVGIHNAWDAALYIAMAKRSG